MSEKNSFILYYELEEQTADFSDAQLGQLLRAIFDHEKRGVDCQIADIAVKTAYRFVSAQLDRNKSKYEDVRTKRQEAGRKGGRPSKPIDSSEKQKKQMLLEKAKKAVNVPVPDNAPASDKNESTGAAAPPSVQKDRHKHGTYGWVKLSDEEYSRLLNDLGQTELERCITYVDESAQSNGNKNKWRDWNLVIRKCSKQGWGRNQANMKGGAANGAGDNQQYSRDWTKGFHE